MENSLCEKYGFDTAGREERLGMMRLGEQDHLLAQQLNERVIRPRLDELIKEFYQYMLSEKLTRQFLKDYDKEKLKRTQRAYLNTLGIGFNTSDYFEQRLKIGLAHAVIKMPLSLYQCAYTYLQILIRQKIDQTEGLTIDERLDLNKFALKVVNLDMSLATDTYFSSNLETLEKTVSSLQDEKETLTSKVNIDMLTGVSSRESILSEANNTISKYQQEDCAFSLLVADIDHFKKVNDTYGHAMGDEVLKKIADRMSHTVRGDDMVGRIGGEEFLVTLPGSGLDAASMVGERIRKAVEASPVTLRGKSMSVTISLGVAELKEEERLSQLIDRADQALYQAKKSGRNRVSLHGAK